MSDDPKWFSLERTPDGEYTPTDWFGRARDLETALLFARDALASLMPTLRRVAPELVDEAHAGLRAAEEALGVYEGPK